MPFVAFPSAIELFFLASEGPRRFLFGVLAALLGPLELFEAPPSMVVGNGLAMTERNASASRPMRIKEHACCHFSCSV